MTDLKPCPFCGGEAELTEGEECAQVQCLEQSWHRGPFADGDNNASAEAIAAWNTRTPIDEPIETLDERMIAAGMIPLTRLLAGKEPLDKWMVHTGTQSIELFQQWVERKHEEYMRMRMRYELGEKDKDDDLYEWVFAHAATFGEVSLNLKQAISAQKG